MWGKRERTLATQLDAQRALKLGQHLLVGHGAARLVVVDDGWLLVDLGGQLLLRHGRLLLLPRLGHCLAHALVHLLWRRHLVFAVHLGQALAIGRLHLVAGCVLLCLSALAFDVKGG